MKKVHRVLSGAVAALMLGGAVQALEPALDTAAFSGVDLGEITQVTLTFDQPSGSIMLREIQAVN